MEQKIELKPCPFCGETKFLQVDDKQEFYELQGESKDGQAAFMMRCTKCDVEMWEHSFHFRNYETRLKLIIEKWNRRAGNGDV